MVHVATVRKGGRDMEFCHRAEFGPDGGFLEFSYPNLADLL